MPTLSQDQIYQILKLHKNWLNCKSGGQKANFSGMDLSGVNLIFTDLQQVNFQGSNLQRADLRWSNLKYANFEGANLQGADLLYSDIKGASHITPFIKHEGSEWGVWLKESGTRVRSYSNYQRGRACLNYLTGKGS